MSRFVSWTPYLAIGGGLVWILYAVQAMLEPLGPVATYYSDQGALLVTNAGAFLLTALTGGLGLILLGLAVVGTARRYALPRPQPERFGSTLPTRFGVAMGWVGAACGLLMIGAGIFRLPPLVGVAQLAGAMLIPLSATLLAIEANGDVDAQPIAAALFLVGMLGLISLLAQAMVSVYPWMLPVYAALVMAVYGFTWVRFGNHLARQADPA